jgi:hypothetical protein
MEDSMLRQLLVVICLVSFAPAAFGAQVPAVAPLPAEVNLSLPVATSRAVMLAAADTGRTLAADAPEHKSEVHSSHSWDNFVEVHFGGYRWIWWAGAAVVLIAIHVVATN